MRGLSCEVISVVEPMVQLRRLIGSGVCRLASLITCAIQERKRGSRALAHADLPLEIESAVNNIIYLVGLVVVILAILAFLGLR